MVLLSIDVKNCGHSTHQYKLCHTEDVVAPKGRGRRGSRFYSCNVKHYIAHYRCPHLIIVK